MKPIFIVFVVIDVFSGIVNCKIDLTGYKFNDATDYSSICGDPYDGEFPWLVKVYQILNRLTDPVYKFMCNGNIIDKYTVLLPAHCVTTPEDNTINAIDVLIEVGKTKFAERSVYTKNHTVSTIIVSPQYNSQVYHNDIAIIKVVELIEFSMYVHPICLTNDITKLNTTQSGIAPIWTHLIKNSTEDILNTAYIPIEYDNDKCKLLDPELIEIINSNNFCAGKQNEIYDLCRGSNGVSLTLIEETQTKLVWYLKGILSYGQSNGDPYICTGPFVFTDVFKFYDWIQEQL